MFKNKCSIANISKRADTFSRECNKSAAFATFEKKIDLIESCFNLFKFRGVSMHNLARYFRTEQIFFQSCFLKTPEQFFDNYGTVSDFLENIHPLCSKSTKQHVVAFFPNSDEFFSLMSKN